MAFVETTLNRRDIQRLRKEWFRVFGGRIRNATSKRRALAAFGGQHEALVGSAAELEYASAAAETLYVLYGNFRQGGILRLVEGTKPAPVDIQYPGCGQRSFDFPHVVVFPPDFSWTMMAGHDESDPVYFTYRDWLAESTGDEY